VDGSLLIVLLIGLMYVVLVMPRRRQMARARQLQASLAPGDAIVTIGGIHGVISAVGNDSLHVVVAPGVEIEMVRDAVARKAPARQADTGNNDGSGPGTADPAADAPDGPMGLSEGEG
jgi:preprotein translocase subunit YajC